MPRLSFRDRLAEHFRQQPGIWIDGMVLEKIAGKYAWRSRVSDCRTQLGMTIENRLRYLKPTNKSAPLYVVSEYRYVPPVPRVIDLAAVKEQRLF